MIRGITEHSFKDGEWRSTFRPTSGIGMFAVAWMLRAWRS